MSRHLLGSRLLSAVLAASMLAACTVGPDYQPPQPQLPEHWSEDHDAANVKALGPWWHEFHDPLLDRMVAQAITGNLDIQMAMQRVEAARADRVVVASADLPSVGAGVSAANSRSSEKLTWPPGLGEYKTYQYGLEASWEIDIFGGTRRAVEASDAVIGAAVEERRAVLVALLGELAADYITLRSSQHRLDIAQRNIEAAQKALELSNRAFTAGMGTDMDVARAHAAFETAQSQIPLLKATGAQMRHAIAVLLGRFPEEMSQELALAERTNPQLPTLPTTLPSEVVRNRPDIRRAERHIAAATARVGVATADLFPHFKIPLGLSPMASNLVNLFDPDSLVWTFGLSATQTLYDGGRSEARIRAAEALAEHDRLAYRQAILTAFREVEDRLIGYSTERQRHAFLTAAAEDERRAFDRATRLYAAGLTDFIKVLDSERALFAAEDAVAQSELAQFLDVIGLYRSLGGGWQEAEAANAAQPSD